MKKLHFTGNHNILKGFLLWLLLLCLLLSLVPASADSSQPNITVADILAGLSDAALYGATANTYTELGYAESNVFVGELIKNDGNPILTSGRSQNAAGSYTLVADITLNAPYEDIASMTFGVFKKTSTGYTSGIRYFYRYCI